MANLHEDLTIRQDTAGDKFRIEPDKQVLDNRGIAGELLLRRAEKIKIWFGEDIRIGRFAGFDLFIRSGFNNTAELVLREKQLQHPRHRPRSAPSVRSNRKCRVLRNAPPRTNHYEFAGHTEKLQ